MTFSSNDTEFATVLVVLSFVAYVFYNFIQRYNYWKERGVPHNRGILEDHFLKYSTPRSEQIHEVYKQFSSKHPFAGYYEASKPALAVFDLSLIQTILIKDFEFMHSRGIVVNEELDPLNSHIFNLPGQRWRDVRSKMSPAFSSGKLKAMFSLMNECTNVLDKHLEKALERSSELDVHDLIRKYCMDVIGTCAFGLDCKAVERPDSEFKLISRKMIPPKLKRMVRVAIRAISPKIIQWLKWHGMHPEVEDFFFTLTRDTIKNRVENNDKRNDLLQLLINIQHEEKKMLEMKNDGSEPIFTESIIAANVFGLFFAGFTPVSVALSFCLYEMALNPDITEKLHEEVVRVQNAHNGQLTYDTVKEMEYVDCFINEIIRLHFPPINGERVCNKAYKVPNSSLVIEEGVKISIPIRSIHRDPRYFPDPLKFNPNRFNAENKSKIIPGTWLPWGGGPRLCIGNRFAVMNMRAALAMIARKYTVHPTPKTEIPVPLNPKAFNNAPKNGIYLRLEKRRPTSSSA